MTITCERTGCEAPATCVTPEPDGQVLDAFCDAHWCEEFGHHFEERETVALDYAGRTALVAVCANCGAERRGEDDL